VQITLPVPFNITFFKKGRKDNTIQQLLNCHEQFDMIQKSQMDFTAISNINY